MFQWRRTGTEGSSGAMRPWKLLIDGSIYQRIVNEILAGDSPAAVESDHLRRRSHLTVTLWEVTLLDDRGGSAESISPAPPATEDMMQMHYLT